MPLTYKVSICGREEDLPILELSGGTKICFFNLHGNVELTEFCARKLSERLYGLDFDVLLTAESKGLQLAHCLARNLNHRFYAVARKSRKLYMQDGIEAEVKSITTGDIQKLYLSENDLNLIKGKRVVIVDDVISTGGSLLGLEKLVERSGGEVAAKCFCLAEGDAKERKDIIYLASIPLF